jgi:hypothetical protein
VRNAASAHRSRVPWRARLSAVLRRRRKKKTRTGANSAHSTSNVTSPLRAAGKLRSLRNWLPITSQPHPRKTHTDIASQCSSSVPADCREKPRANKRSLFLWNNMHRSTRMTNGTDCLVLFSRNVSQDNTVAINVIALSRFLADTCTTCVFIEGYTLCSESGIAALRR